MAKTRIKFRASSVGTKEGTIYYQVIHNRVARQIHTEYRIFPSEWDAVHASIVLPSSATPQRYSYLLSLQDTLEADRKKLLLVIARLDKEAQPYTSDKVVEYFREGKELQGIVGYTMELNEKLRQIGKRRMAERYTTTIHSLHRYLKGKDVPLEDVDGTMMQGYEQWLKESGLCRNTTSFYIRNLRTIYNRAVEEGLVVSSSPFKHVYTGIEKTAKRALPLEIIKQLKNINLNLNPRMELARDMFLFSFYTRGMSFIDMAQLTKNNLQDGVLTYRRQKTSQQLHIKWEAPMQEIVTKYQTDSSPYLLPIATGEEGAVFWKKYKNAYNRITKQLKKLGEMLGLSIPLTTYVARHSWASVARSKNVAITTISEGLGHDSEKTTRIYLASLDTSVVDKANSLIINSF
ncbi:MAG: tyrosine-type recombinase/integrase [Parabacteroides sp.]